ncbi:MAG: hypothetical protein S4CHLAM102_11170 [Chlamydiia bacterium]|nr:hypothetical protein [Chlamydiia bacterium]
MSKSKWYADGLYFKCTGCGGCCTGSPGYVWLKPTDINRLCKHLNIQREEFLKKYTRQVGRRIALLEDPKTYDCVFLKGKRCSVYEGRPIQCSTFPWWPEHTKTKKSWARLQDSCEGVNHKDSVLVSEEEIEKGLSNFSS